jgi:biopolymer transport protein ExbD
MAEIATGNKRSPRLDMTPMVDLVFLLLTFFMLTAVFTERYVIKINMPEEIDNQTQPVNQKKVVTLILGANNKIYWYKGLDTNLAQTDFSSTGIRPVLQELNHSIKDLVVLIKPSKESRYQNLIDVFDEMSISDIERYYLVDITSEDINLVQTKLKQHE